MSFFVIDFESHLFKSGVTLPRAVCAGVSTFNDEGELESSRVLLREEALDELERKIGIPWVQIVNHNLAFDLALAAVERPRLLGMIVRALEAGRCRCTLNRQILLDIARGEAGTDDGKNAFRRRSDREPYVAKSLYGLDDLMLWHFGEHLEKKDTWRLKYALLDGVPLEEWPEEAIEYPKKDTVSAFRLFGVQRERASQLRAAQEYEGWWDSEDGEIPDEHPQLCYAFALKLMEAHGLRTHAEKVAEFVRLHEEREARLFEALGPDGIGIMRDDEDRSMDKAATANAIERAFAFFGERAPRTPPSGKFPLGQVKEDGETLTAIGKRCEAAGEPIRTLGKALRLLGESKSDRTTANTWIPWLIAGTRGPVCPSFWPLVASGRLSARKPNVTNPPRKGAIRNCFRARDGRVFFAADFDTAEMRAHAQNCLELVGWSDLADALQRGEDPHIHLAAELLGLSYEEAWKRYEDGDDEVGEARQFCKIGNFGFMGGLGADGFVEYAAGYGFEITVEQGKNLRNAWFRKWKENRKYFEIIGNVAGNGGDGILQQVPSKRVRGGLWFTEAANTMFQGRTADGAKRSLWKVFLECYLGEWTYEPQNDMERARKARGERSPLYGSRLQILMHDELIGETPDPVGDSGAAGRAAERLAHVMRSAMQEVTPDIPARASPVLMRVWYKGAKAVRDAVGNLRPSRPVEVETGELDRNGKPKKKTKWVVDDERIAA